MDGLDYKKYLPLRFAKGDWETLVSIFNVIDKDIIHIDTSNIDYTREKLREYIDNDTIITSRNNELYLIDKNIISNGFIIEGEDKKKNSWTKLVEEFDKSINEVAEISSSRSPLYEKNKLEEIINNDYDNISVNKIGDTVYLVKGQSNSTRIKCEKCGYKFREYHKNSSNFHRCPNCGEFFIEGENE